MTIQETEVEEGFRAYCAERNLPVEFIVRNVDRKREAIPGFVAEAQARIAREVRSGEIGDRLHG